MGRKKTGRRAVVVTDPEGLGAWVKRYLQWMAVQQYAARSIERMQEELLLFLDYCAERSIGRPEEVSKAVLESYQRHLFALRKRNGKPLHPRTQRGRLTSVRSLFRWLAQQNVLLFNPAAELQLPKESRPLPKDVLSASEVDTVLDQTDVGTPLGLRDRAIMELLYSTGMRRAELAALSVYDVDHEQALVRIRKGKGGRQRVVPVGERALLWLRKYLDDIRPGLLVSSIERQETLFLSSLGEPLSLDRLSVLVSGYIQAAELGKRGSCHLLRHSMATLMLQGGADIRYVQQMLGHASLETTQLYTHLAIGELQAVHARTHPSARLPQGKGGDDEPRPPS